MLCCASCNPSNDKRVMCAATHNRCIIFLWIAHNFLIFAEIRLCSSFRLLGFAVFRFRNYPVSLDRRPWVSNMFLSGGKRILRRIEHNKCFVVDPNLPFLCNYILKDAEKMSSRARDTWMTFTVASVSTMTSHQSSSRSMNPNWLVVVENDKALNVWKKWMYLRSNTVVTDGRWFRLTVYSYHVDD